MAEQVVRIEGTVPTSPTGTQNVAVTGQPISATISSQPIQVTNVSNPAILGAYIFSVENLPGVAASNNFLTLFNPVGSGRIYLATAVFVSCVAAAAASAVRAFRGYRIGAAPTGGSVQAASTFCKIDTAYPDSGADVRIGNPTATLQQPFSNTPPPVTTGAGGSQFVHSVELPLGSPSFRIRAGEGVAFNTAVGDTDQVWNISIAWAEVSA